jgi:segregation and condensation protein A
MQEMMMAFRDVVQRAEMFAHHHVQRERLSVRVRMSDILATLERSSFVEFVHLFKAEEGRMGVTVTFVAILELVREGLIDIVQTEAYAPLHVRGAQGARGLRLAVDNDAELGDAVSDVDVEGAANESVIDESAQEIDPEPAPEQMDGDQHE